MIDDLDPVDPSIAGLPSPRSRASLIGHDQAASRLVRSWQRGVMHHALLLTGPRGIGKATLAYQIAKMVISGADDLAGGLGTPADRQIAQGASQQFRRLARAANPDGKLKREIGVEDVRALTPFLRQRSGRSDWRVVLIDAANDLNVSSANALLKVLEEPGDRTLFLLVAHGSDDLLTTIRSRCLSVRCDPLSSGELGQVLRDSSLSSADIERALPFAHGSVRRAITLAEGEGIETVEQLERILAKAQLSPSDAQRLADAVARKDGEHLFELVREELPRSLRHRAKALGLPRATAIADATTELSRSWAEREEFGVDRALSVKAALYRAHGALWSSP